MLENVELSLKYFLI